jgi:hypothetical protein
MTSVEVGGDIQFVTGGMGFRPQGRNPIPHPR